MSLFTCSISNSQLLCVIQQVISQGPVPDVISHMACYWELKEIQKDKKEKNA